MRLKKQETRKIGGQWSEVWGRSVGVDSRPSLTGKALDSPAA